MNGSFKIFFLISILIAAAMGCSSSADSSTALSGAAKISRAVITPSLAEIPDLYSRFTAVGLEASIKTKRDLFRFESPETDAVEGGNGQDLFRVDSGLFDHGLGLAEEGILTHLINL